VTLGAAARLSSTAHVEAVDRLPAAGKRRRRME